MNKNLGIILMAVGGVAVATALVLNFTAVRLPLEDSSASNKQEIYSHVNQGESTRKNFVNISDEAVSRSRQHEMDIKAIDQAHNLRMAASVYLKDGDLQLAAEALEKAYAYKEHPFTGHAVTAFDLANIYEKLGRYDDAIAILDGMIKNKETNDFGIQRANEIKSRLLAAKSSTKQ